MPTLLQRGRGAPSRGSLRGSPRGRGITPMRGMPAKRGVVPMRGGRGVSPLKAGAQGVTKGRAGIGRGAGMRGIPMRGRGVVKPGARGGAVNLKGSRGMALATRGGRGAARGTAVPARGSAAAIRGAIRGRVAPTSAGPAVAKRKLAPGLTVQPAPSNANAAKQLSTQQALDSRAAEQARQQKMQSIQQ